MLDIAPARKGVAWGRIKEILSPSPSRVTAFCAYFGECGGCQLQHISYPAQLEYKRLIVEDAFRRVGGVRDANVDPCVGSPAQRRYRSRARFHCRRGEIGFHKSRSNMILPLEYCPVLPDGINACLRQFSAHLSAHPLPDLLGVQMMEDSDSRVTVVLEMNAFPDDRAINGLREHVAVAGAAAGVGHRTRVLWGEHHSKISVDGRAFRVGPSAFFQANTSLLPTLTQQVLCAIGTDDIDTGIELYAGVGLFTVALSERVRKLLAVEWNRDAVEDATANLSTNRIDNVEVIALSAEEALDRVAPGNDKLELVVMDPPREGLSTRVRSRLLRLSPRQLVYISCDPATLARDVKSFLNSGAYRLEQITPLDMFPHTAHIECLCSLMRR